jgi:hypothetical protein
MAVRLAEAARDENKIEALALAGFPSSGEWT